ncbi:MAG: type II toxin-antitoxin system RelE/ParE family toxin [Firmicutes bacterium]|nr:type II toxin-antitoxin system RelE/ParE family toxin [Bacillota bacterium]
MMYSVVITKQAEEDLHGIFEYISFTLYEPGYAAHKLQKLEQAISRLNYMPERYKKYEEEPWAKIGLRKMPVDNYNIFYFVDNEIEQVTVLRILYSKRDETKQLRQHQALNLDEFVLHEEIKEYVL